MTTLPDVAAAIPDDARDIRLNLNAVLAPGALTPAQRWGAALAAAYAVRDDALAAALRGGADAELGEAAAAVVADAQAAAALMAMNNVAYRFRHLVGGAYEQKPLRLRMNRMMQPRTDAGTFELLSLAVSAINGCQVCVQAHERSVRGHGLGEDQVLDAVRIAAVVAASAVARRLQADKVAA